MQLNYDSTKQLLIKKPLKPLLYCRITNKLKLEIDETKHKVLEVLCFFEKAISFIRGRAVPKLSSGDTHAQ